MVIEVKLFGPQAQLARRSSVRITMDSPATCSALRRRLAEAAPELTSTLSASRFAINHEYADEHRTIDVGDEVALIGMVSGG